jgi:hypothetical protein
LLVESREFSKGGPHAFKGRLMNLFLLGWSPSGTVDADRAEGSFARILEELPFLDSGCSQSWRAPTGRLVACSASHRATRAGGVRCAHFDVNRFAMYSGRPFVWTGEFAADGRATLDPRFYLEPPEAWSDALDGRCVVARYDDESSTLDLFTDQLGGGHLYAAKDTATQWFSNNAELLRRIIGARNPVPLALASLVACGWSLGGQPVWQDIRRLSRGTVYRFRPERETCRELLPTSAIETFFDRGFEAESAARVLVAAVRALAEWPGRPSVVPLTGGRDSRLVFAAALQANVDFEPRIIAGNDETPDARTARILCTTEGRELEVAHPRHIATIEDAVDALRLCAPGTLTLDLAWNALNRPKDTGVPTGQGDSPLALVHSGHGGELARAYYGLGDQSAAAVEKGLFRHITHVWPRPPISKEGQQSIREYIARWVHDQVDAGVAPQHLPDLFYLLERMSNWVGGSHGFDEYMVDITSPLWSPRLLPHEFGLPPSARSRELFHFHVLGALRPELTRVPFAGSNPPWPTFGGTRTASGRRVRHVRRLATRVGNETRRRYEYRRGRRTDARLTEAAAIARQRVPEASHAVWQVIDRKRALAILARDPMALDIRSQRTIWRLATAFLVCLD